MTRISALHKKWMKEPPYRKAYKDLEQEFREAPDSQRTIKLKLREKVGKRKS